MHPAMVMPYHHHNEAAHIEIFGEVSKTMVVEVIPQPYPRSTFVLKKSHVGLGALIIASNERTLTNCGR